jgi:hypothetical protein
MNADLFAYFASNHNLTLLESEICDIEHVVNSSLTQLNQRLAVKLAALNKIAVDHDFDPHWFAAEKLREIERIGK